MTKEQHHIIFLVDVNNEIVPLIQNLINGARIQKNGYPHKSIQDKIQEIVDNVRAKYKLHYLTVKYSQYSVLIDMSYCYQVDAISCNYIKDKVYIADVDKQVIDTSNRSFTQMYKTTYEEILRQKETIEENKKKIDILEGEISSMMYQTSIFRDE